MKVYTDPAMRKGREAPLALILMHLVLHYPFDQFYKAVLLKERAM